MVSSLIFNRKETFMNKKIKSIITNRKVQTYLVVGIYIALAPIMIFVSAPTETKAYYDSEINYRSNLKEMSWIDIFEEIPIPEMPETADIETSIIEEHLEPEMLHVTWSDKVQLTMEEFYMICNTVYYEARGCTPQEQSMVALTILNRVNSDSFPNTVYEVLTSPNQYDPKYTDYSGFIWSEEIEQSVTYALECNDYHPDMVYYRADHYFTGSFQIPYMHIGGCWFSIQNK